MKQEVRRIVRTQVLEAGRRVLGLVLLALVAAPAFFVLSPEPLMGPEGLMRRAGREQWVYTWGGAGGIWTLLVVGGAVFLAALTRGRLSQALARLGAVLERPPRWAVALFVGALGAALTTWVAQAVFDGRTIVNDASVQLIQARYFAAGHLAGPPLVMPEFWSIQFMVHTAAGWVSQYPPAHALALAAGFELGAPWITMAFAMGVMGVCAVASLERLLPERIAAARVAALLCVVSPLLLGLAASYMNHAMVAALATLALYLALRAEEGSVGWALAAGAAVGAMVTTRPVSGLAIGVVVTASIWLTARRHADGFDRPWLLRRFGAWALGGLPFGLAFGWFNARFFGSPFTLGYTAASGPNHGLGFHDDPWGRMYGATQALGYTSAELVSLGRELLGTPLPIVALIGGFLLLARRLTRGERILVAWAVVPVIGSALYWHHDLIFGPRMLGGAVPAWCALFVISSIGLAGLSRRGWASDAIAVVLLAGLGYAAVIGGPGRVTRLGSRLAPLPDVMESAPTLVFVHELWPDRVGGRLAGRGMRLDSVRALLTQYHPCQLEAAFLGQQISEVGARCNLENASDSLGALGLTNYLWLDDLPGLEGTGVLWARDLGPEANGRLIGAHPDRSPRFLLPETRGGEWRVVPYEEGLRRLWGGVVDSAGGGITEAESLP